MKHPPQTENSEYLHSQNLVNASLDGDETAVQSILSNDEVDINDVGTVNLCIRQLDFVQREELSDELKVEHVLFKTDVTPLFAAAHSGRVNIVKNLLTAGADVNQRIFKGYAITAAAREGHGEVLSILLKAGAYQPAREEAFLEACLAGQVETTELLMKWEMARAEILASALIHASSRGFLDVVELLVKTGVDLNSWHRVLLRSLKPSLHSNLDCTPLIAAIVSRQPAVVKYLLNAGARSDCKARLGAWSWDATSEEVLRVGAGMAEPFDAAWCAIEYWESTGSILRTILERVSANSELHGRTLLCHAVLCGNGEAAEALLENGANAEHCICTDDGAEFRPIHLASRKGLQSVLKVLISHGCNLDVQTEKGDTALILSVVHGHCECFRELLHAGADSAARNKAGQNAIDIAEDPSQDYFVYQTVCDVILSGKKLHSNDLQVFSPLHFIARHGNSEVIRKLVERKDGSIDQKDKFGVTAIMIAAQEGHIEVFKVLVFAGANIGLKNMQGETAMTLAEANGNKEQCEKVLCDAILAGVLKGADFSEIHFAVKKGDCELLAQLIRQGHSVNALDSEGYTPLMVCVREGHADACKFLLSRGADCYLASPKGETALSLVQKKGSKKVVEEVIIDHIARKVVLTGGSLSKHTKQGKGKPHMKSVKLLKSGVLSWGASKRRNILCTEACIGGSQEFQENRKNRDARKSGLYTFRVASSNGREVHFDATGSFPAELWARGINLVAKELELSNG